MERGGQREDRHRREDALERKHWFSFGLRGAGRAVYMPARERVKQQVVKICLAKPALGF
jgi:hypothetical protein